MRFLKRRRLIAASCAALALTGLAGGVWRLARSGILVRAEAVAAARTTHIGAELGFAVENVSVTGRERESRHDILDAVGAARGAPILNLDLAAAKSRLEALPWVRTADVERLLPDTIFVHLAERHPLALWQRQEKLALVADDGTVMAGQNIDAYGSLIVIVGDDAPKLAPQLFAMLASEPALCPHVAAAVRVGGRRWNLKLDSGIDVALPEEDADAAWHRLAALDRSESLLERNLLAVDLRLPDRLVVRLPPEPKSSAKKKTGGNPT
jgi:cell division protein FtsQ